MVLMVTRDGSTVPPGGRWTAAIVREVALQRHGWNIVGGSPPGEAVLTSHRPRRRDLVELGRLNAAEIAVGIHVYESQANRGSRTAFAIGYALGVDSAAYFAAPEVAWAVGDTIAMRRTLAGLVARLSPVPYSDCCFGEIRTTEEMLLDTTRMPNSQFLVKVRDAEGRGVAGATVSAHWVVDARREARTTKQCDGAGLAVFDFDSLPGEQAFSLTEFAIDTAWCQGLVYDRHWPFRGVDQAVAILANGEADLDEDRNYDSAKARLQRFIDLGPEDVEMYNLVVFTRDAVDRKHRAQLLLRRAISESERPHRPGIRPNTGDTGWSARISFSHAIDTERSGELTVEPVDCDTCSAIPLEETKRGGNGFTVSVIRRMSARFWLTAGGSIYYSKLYRKASGRAKAHRLDVKTYSLEATATFPWELQGDFIAYGELGARVSSTRHGAPRYYWADKTFYAEQPPEGEQLYLEPDPADERVRPGAFARAGFMFRVSAWIPLWWSLDFGYHVDRVESGRTQGTVMGRGGATYRWY